MPRRTFSAVAEVAPEPQRGQVGLASVAKVPGPRRSGRAPDEHKFVEHIAQTFGL
jgi:hypothetical protein